MKMNTTMFDMAEKQAALCKVLGNSHHNRCRILNWPG